MRICLIDPGIKNFALYIEEFDEKAIVPFKGKRFNKDRTSTHEYSNYQNIIYKNGKSIYFNCVSIFPHKGTFRNNMNTVRMELTKFFNSIREYLDTCDAFICERQLKINPYAQMVEYHCYSYFTWIYGNNRIIMDVCASEKYSFLGCEKRLRNRKEKGKRKKWAVDVCEGILTLRNNNETLFKFYKHKKKDDISDTIIMCQALKIRAWSS